MYNTINYKEKIHFMCLFLNVILISHTVASSPAIADAKPQVSRRQISAYLRGTVVVRPCIDLDNDGSLKSSLHCEPESGSTELESRYVRTRVRFLCIAHWCFNSTVFMFSQEDPLVALISAPTAPDRLQPPLQRACVHIPWSIIHVH